MLASHGIREALLALVVMSNGPATYAQTGNPANNLFAKFALSALKAHCNIVTTKHPTETAMFTRPEHEYIFDNATLHQCQYVHEVQDRCLLNKSCPTYEEWSEASPELDPPYATSCLLGSLEARRAKVTEIKLKVQ